MRLVKRSLRCLMRDIRDVYDEMSRPIPLRQTAAFGIISLTIAAKYTLHPSPVTIAGVTTEDPPATLLYRSDQERENATGRSPL